MLFVDWPDYTETYIENRLQIKQCACDLSFARLPSLGARELY